MDATPVSNDAAKTASVLLPLGIPCIRVWGVTNNVCRCPKGADCPSPGKHPIGGAWQNNPIASADQVQPGDNLGVLLGPNSGVVDIEFDDPAGEARARELGLFESETVSFTSGKSRHWLFRYDPDLPQKAVVPSKMTGSLEIRIGAEGGAQSVLPGSTHASGKQYAWVEGCEP